MRKVFNYNILYIFILISYKIRSGDGVKKGKYMGNARILRGPVIPMIKHNRVILEF